MAWFERKRQIGNTQKPERKGGFLCGYCGQTFDIANESSAFNHDSDSALCDRRRKDGL
jgi:hypothetical protein